MKICIITFALASFCIYCAFTFPLVLENKTISGATEAHAYSVNPEELGYEFQGDIVASNEEIIHLKSGILNQQQKWPLGILVYSISPKFTTDQVNIIRLAMDMISKQTCIRFRQTQFGDVSYVRFEPHETGCMSNLGMQVGRNQNINLADRCFTSGGGNGGTIAHEIIHALGWAHEHTRTDRDDFIEVDFDNIVEYAKPNYEILNGTSAYGVVYDFSSIMHYGLRGGFAVNRTKNIMNPRKNYTGTIGQRENLSVFDALKINNMYHGICKN